MYLTTTPWWLKKMYAPGLTWNVASENEIYLTFDDGPHPVITPFVLACLKKFNASATFFCIGKNVAQYPELFREILMEGHRTGNHTHNHLNGWRTGSKDYLADVGEAQKYINSNLFRPPYGRITRQQAKQLRASYDIIMWSVLSGDFDTALSPQRCYENVIKNAKAGSVIVFHDSEKAFPRLEYALPKALKYFSEKGFELKALQM